MTAFVFCASLSSSSAATVNACDNLDTWSAFLIDNQMNEVLSTYTPEEFFTPNGAEVPGYEPITDRFISPKFVFNIPSCKLDSFYVEFTFEFSDYDYYDYGYRRAIATIGYMPKEYYGIDYVDFPSFLRSKDESSVEHIQISSDSVPSNTSKLRYSNTPNYLWALYKNGVLYSSDGLVKPVEICTLEMFGITWNRGGGRVKQVYVEINDKKYLEDFSDCHNAMTYDECPPEEPAYVNPSYKLPTCEDEYLYLTAESNMPDVHWVALNNKFEGSRVSIPIDEMTGGCYAVWTQLDSCSPIVLDTVCPPIPDLMPKESLVRKSLCWNEPFYVDGKRVTESGVYGELLKTTVTKCDSFVTYDINVMPADTVFLDTIYKCVSELTSQQYVKDTIDSYDQCPKLKMTPIVNISESDRIKIDDYVVDDDNTEITVYTSNNLGDVKYYYYPPGVETDVNTIPLDMIGKYSIIAYDAMTNCSDSISYMYEFQVRPDTFWDPEKDGVWKIHGLSKYANHAVRIYDRFGRMLLYCKNNFTGWDGTYLGHKMPSTDYWYTVEYDDYKSYGHFTLLRSKE